MKRSGRAFRRSLSLGKRNFNLLGACIYSWREPEYSTKHWGIAGTAVEETLNRLMENKSIAEAAA